MRGDNPDAERTIAAACRTQDLQSAATLAIDSYGAEILSFLIKRLRSQSAGEDAFSMFAEDLWTGLPSYEQRCSVRGYLYTLARNAANRYASAPHQRRERNLPVTGNSSVSALIADARTVTQPHLRTDIKSRMRALREQLPADDEMLLALHIDRALPWREIAMVLCERGETLSDLELERESARLRKRFERVKAELREIARREGLFGK